MIIAEYVCIMSSIWCVRNQRNPTPLDASESLLRHERYHLRISEVAALKLAAELKTFTVTESATNAKEALDKAVAKYRTLAKEAYDRIEAERKVKQKAYDDDTAHGTVPTEQTRWEGIVDGWVQNGTW